MSAVKNLVDMIRDSRTHETVINTPRDCFCVRFSSHPSNFSIAPAEKS